MAVLGNPRAGLASYKQTENKGKEGRSLKDVIGLKVTLPEIRPAGQSALVTG